MAAAYCASGWHAGPEAFYVWAKEAIDCGLWGGIIKPLSQGDGLTQAVAISWGESSQRSSIFAGKTGSLLLVKNTHNATQLDMIAEPGEKLDFCLENVYIYEEGRIKLEKGGDNCKRIKVNTPDAINSRRLTSGEKIFS